MNKSDEVKRYDLIFRVAKAYMGKGEHGGWLKYSDFAHERSLREAAEKALEEEKACRHLLAKATDKIRDLETFIAFLDTKLAELNIDNQNANALIGSQAEENQAIIQRLMGFK